MPPQHSILVAVIPSFAMAAARLFVWQGQHVVVLFFLWKEGIVEFDETSETEDGLPTLFA